MDNSDNGSNVSAIEKLQTAVSLLEQRISNLEYKLKSGTVETVKTGTPEIQKEDKSENLVPEKKWENVTGASQLGWMAVIVSLIGAGFFIRYTFLQNWILGWGQPITLIIVGFILVAISDRLIRKKMFKFGSTLTVCGYAVLFLSFYWMSVRLNLVSPYIMILCSFILWSVSIMWGILQKSSLWPLWGFLGAGLMPVLMLNSEFAVNYLPVYYNLLIIITLIVSVLKDWSWFTVFGSIIGHTAIFFSNKYFFQVKMAGLPVIIAMISTIPAILILLSGIIHIYAKRDAYKYELLSWAGNNFIIYTGIRAVWKKVNVSYLLLIPILFNGILYFYARRNIKGSKYNVLYLSGLVLSSGIAMTALLPEPFDIISLCFFSVYLAHRGNRKQGWDYKGLSGAIVMWCIFFLFTFRFDFTATSALPFINLRFVSFAVAFLCFGYQGKMINNDPDAGKMGSLLGQGLFSLGLLVLLSGMGSELMQLFPPVNHEFVSDNALLSLTILGALFSFVVTYLGLVLRLFFIRILALGLFLLLTTKLVLLDLPALAPLYLIISLATVGILLGGTSMLLKKFKTLKVNE